MEKKVKKRIYISGKITDNPAYKLQFAAGERIVRFAGFEPVNPTKDPLPEGATWADYMRRDIQLLCDCDGVFMLKNWKKSRGAKLEHYLAKQLGLSIAYEV